jgi:hypothetical protein
MLAVFSLLVIGALLAAYFLARPEHSAATRTVTVPTASGAKQAPVTGPTASGAKQAPVTRPTASVAPLAQVPDVVNQEQGSARAKLRSAGFESRVQPVPARGSAAAGVVIQESPVGGAEAPKGSAITLWVSVRKAKNRPLVNGVTVPNVLRLQKTVAQSKLTAAGLGASIRYVASRAAAGQVISQSPAVGVRVKRGKKILLAVSRSR